MLTFIPEDRLPQGSGVWLERRRIVGTATQCACVMGEPLPYKDSPKTWRELRSERAFGSTFKGNADSERGKQLEPVAREAFNSDMGRDLPEMHPVWAERLLRDEGTEVHIWGQDGLPEIKGPTIASSYDGYGRDGDLHVWLEIKCPRNKRSKIWQSLEANRIPDDYYWQFIHQYATFGKRDALGYFMAYLDGGEMLVMSMEDDGRYQTGQMNRDADLVEKAWGLFLEGMEQASDFSRNQEWLEIERELAEAGDWRKQIEASAKPYADAEKKAKARMKEFVTAQLGENSGLRRLQGGRIHLTNTPQIDLDLEAFRQAHAEISIADYQSVKTDVERLVNDHPVAAAPFVTIKDSWRVYQQ